MSIWTNTCSGKICGREPEPAHGQVMRYGVILTRDGGTGDTPQDREGRIQALAERYARGERLFEPGELPAVQPNRGSVVI